jgi:hypothetical protein
LNGLYLPDRVKAEADGQEIVAFKKDFQGAADIQPVSDPTIYSDQQRMNQIGAVQSRMMAVPNLYKARKVELEFLKLMRLPEPESWLVDQSEPKELNAVNENVAMAMGRPVVAFPDQDHLAHIQVILDFAGNPMLGANPIIAQGYLPHALQHLKEHIVFFYVRHMLDVVTKGGQIAQQDLVSKDAEVKEKLDQLFATAEKSKDEVFDAFLKRYDKVYDPEANAKATLEKIERSKRQAETKKEGGRP